MSYSSRLPADSIDLRDNVAGQRDLQLHVSGAANHRISAEPSFMYSNSGYEVLGELIAAVDGRSYPEYAEQEVLSPVGMDRSTFDQTVPCEADDAMTGYLSENDDRVPTEDPLEFETQPADSGLISRVPEITRLLRCLLNDGTWTGRACSPPSRSPR